MSEFTHEEMQEVRRGVRERIIGNFRTLLEKSPMLRINGNLYFVRDTSGPMGFIAHPVDLKNENVAILWTDFYKDGTFSGAREEYGFQEYYSIVTIDRAGAEVKIELLSCKPIDLSWVEGQIKEYRAM